MIPFCQVRDMQIYSKQSYLRDKIYNLHMGAKGRGRVALAIGALWAAWVVASFYFFSEIQGQNMFWFDVFVSLLLMIGGLAVFFGHVRIFFPFIFMSKEELSQYNMERVSFTLGILIAFISYPLIFLTMGGFIIALAIVCVAVMAIEVGVFYVSAAKKFRVS